MRRLTSNVLCLVRHTEAYVIASNKVIEQSYVEPNMDLKVDKFLINSTKIIVTSVLQFQEKWLFVYSNNYTKARILKVIKL